MRLCRMREWASVGCFFVWEILIDKNLDIFKKIQNSFGFKVQTSYNVCEREQYENSRKVRNENGKKRTSGNEIFE